MPHKNDVFGAMLQASFRGVVFECQRAEIEINHATVVHTYPDRNGGRVENLGREPIPYRFKIPFLRGVDPVMYPQRWREFCTAFQDGSTGDLIHPELGAVRVKPTKSMHPWVPETRDGVVVECTFLESNEDGEAFARSLAQKAPYLIVEASFTKAKAALLALPEPPDENLFDQLEKAKNALRVVAGTIDRGRVGIDNVFARVAGVIVAADVLMTSVEKTWDPAAYEGLKALSDLASAAAAQAEEIAGKRIVPRRVPRDMPVEAAAAFVAMTLDAFFDFNPSLAGASGVRKGEIVYASQEA
ncbi:MAG: DNA circularization N-terminal domain-containing protein [Polyangiaceae bacterium]|nr:DNA circularization N-terminal domain-containing protein [Polyangiaceae bacterium]